MLQLHKNDFRTHLDYFQTLWTMFVLSIGCHLFSIQGDDPLYLYSFKYSKNSFPFQLILALRRICTRPTKIYPWQNMYINFNVYIHCTKLLILICIKYLDRKFCLWKGSFILCKKRYIYIVMNKDILWLVQILCPLCSNSFWSFSNLTTER